MRLFLSLSSARPIISFSRSYAVISPPAAIALVDAVAAAAALAAAFPYATSLSDGIGGFGGIFTTLEFDGETLCSRSFQVNIRSSLITIPLLSTLTFNFETPD